jgi:hypothetical protein
MAFSRGRVAGSSVVVAVGPRSRASSSAAPAAKVVRTVPMLGPSTVPAISACQRSQRSSAISPDPPGRATMPLHTRAPFSGLVC